MLVPGWLAGTLIFTAMAHTSIAGVDAQPAATDGSQGAAQGSALLDRLAITGDASNDIEDVVRKAILRGLSGQGVRTVEPPADVAAAGPCTDAACTAARARAAGSDFVVSGKVLVSERSYEVTLELHEGKDGRLLATRRASCPICSVPEVEKAAADVAGELAGDFRASKASAPAITSEPPGALVYVDGALVGPSPVTPTLTPGEHRIEVKKDGYFDAARTVTIGPDTPADALAFALVARPTSGSVKAALGWTAIGAGAAALLTGVALLAVDERPYRGLCDGEYVDSFGRCRFRYDTLAGGVAGVVVGAGLIGAGAALVVLDRKRSAPRTRAAARLRLGADLRGVTLSGRF